MTTIATFAPAMRPMGCPTCSVPNGPELPQVPVAIPTTPVPDWSRGVFAAATGARGAAALVVDGAVGDVDGYATWVDATAAARALSSTLGRAVAVMDHNGRLYLRTLHVPTGFPFLGMGRQYAIGSLGERVIDFALGSTMRGIIQNGITLTRGDCLVPRVLVR